MRWPRPVCVSASALPLALCMGVASVPSQAHACGGTFCDNGPVAMPVDQTGENILFVIEDGTVEAHVQIQYDGAAERFAWVIPLQAVPELSVGSDALFQRLLGATVPTYQVSRSFDDCGPPPDDEGDGDGWGGGEGDGDGGDGGSDDDGGPDVVYSDTVGAFDVTVLQGGTAAEVMEWLEANDYAQDPAAEPILAEYLEEGFLFAAVKLTAGADVDEIHPIVIRYQGDEPCVPIRLTRIAAQDDMDIRVFVLGDARAAPASYRHVRINPARIDWRLPSAYKEVVTRAVDEADGHAFVTEFAGTSCIVPQDGLVGAAWDAEAFRCMDAADVIYELDLQGLAGCRDGGCDLLHPLLLPLLRQYLPAPAGVDEVEFYACVDCHWTHDQRHTWDSNGFADALRERVMDPARHAVELLQRWPWLTRLYTTISPHEMTVDPTFLQNADLPAVDSQHLGSERVMCDGHSVVTLEDGREVFLPGRTWPELDEMPWAETIETIPGTGAPMVLVDNRDAIDDALRSHGERNGWSWSSDPEPVPPPPDPGAACVQSVVDPPGRAASTVCPVPPAPRGCACATDREPPPAGWMLAGLVGLLVPRRRHPIRRHPPI